MHLFEKITSDGLQVARTGTYAEFEAFNDQYDYIAAQKMYERLGIEITPEIKQELLNEKQETLIRLRKNGF